MKRSLGIFMMLTSLLLATACSSAAALSPDELQEAIFVAAREEDASAMKQYIDAGADIDQANEDGVTVLQIATLRGNLEMIKLLLEAGAGFDARTFHYAIEGSEDNVDIVQAFIDRGADVSGRDDGPPGHSPLMYAAEHGYLEVGKLLLASGADLEQVDDFNDPAVNVAAFHGQLEFVKMLVGMGAQLDVRGYGGRNAIGHAIANRHDEVAAFLREAGGPE